MTSNPVLVNIGKWLKTIEITFSKHTAYRLNFLLQVLGPFLVFFFLKYNLWDAIYKGDKTTVINGYQFGEMITYHLWVLVIGLVGNGHLSFDLATDIRLGRISSYLIYPFNFWEFHTANFISFQLVQLFVSIITIISVSLMGLVVLPDISTIMVGTIYVIYVSFFWFSLQFLTGIIGFWLEQTWMLRVIIGLTAGFLSGAVIPLDFFPESVLNIIQYTPFPYMTFYPTQFFMGKEVELLKGFAVISIWMVLIFILNRWIWNKGIRMYTGAGI